MAMKPGFLTGIRYVLRGFKLLTVPGVRKYVIAPLLINIVVFSTAIWFGATAIWEKTTGLPDEVAASLPDWLDWLLVPLEWLMILLVPLFLIAALVVMFYTFTLFANLIGAPFNGFMAAHVEAHLKGRPVDASDASIITEAIKALLSEFKKLGYFLIRALPLLILFIIPVVNIIAAPLWLLFSAWMLALEYADYPLANHGLAFPQQRVLLRQYRSLSLGFGFGMTVMTMVPILNFLAMPTGVAGATALMVDHLDMEQLTHQEYI